MKKTPPENEQGGLLYRLYQSLPLGVAFLDSHEKVLSANRLFRRYFPCFAEGALRPAALQRDPVPPDLRWTDSVKAADRILYRAKKEGKNRIAIL